MSTDAIEEISIPVASSPVKSPRAEIAGHHLSIIVPVGPGEAAYRRMEDEFSKRPQGTEVLFVGTAPEPNDWAEWSTPLLSRGEVRWLTSPEGRAIQLNNGARVARGEFLLFLHADSRLSPDALDAMLKEVRTSPGELRFYRLEFDHDGPAQTRWNTGGARFRSEYLGLPFGDQGLCLHRELFERIGPYDESVKYGEDHLLVWAAHHAGVSVRHVDAVLKTSSRRYRDQGWLSVTLRHLYLTVKQAVPQLLSLWKRRLWG
ncbi:glycosyltransferase [Calycomorphotria hydatis]|uniref:Glycosyl transferase family 2 n=1 Tax=Calycomorphotria hydatis TaxID=2528027 RepID=A0A517TD31_9PLAN|nr:glycosyltransferase [Calycomorphotria hydatis]QDT66279.1 Glycosyl transferase family 2 [Calycomorphotria hydatis]